MAMQDYDLRIPPELAIDDEPFSDLDYDKYAHVADPDSAVAKFVVDSDGLAEWAMAHVAELDARLEAATAQRDAYHERINAWYERDTASLSTKREFFAMHLRQYLRALREADPDVKSVKLPSGAVVSRVSGPRMTVTNEAEAIAYLKTAFTVEQLDEPIKVTEKVLVSKLAGLVKIDDGRAVDAESGVVVPGMGVEPRGVTYDVKPA